MTVTAVLEDRITVAGPEYLQIQIRHNDVKSKHHSAQMKIENVALALALSISTATTTTMEKISNKFSETFIPADGEGAERGEVAGQPVVIYRHKRKIVGLTFLVTAANMPISK